MAENNGTADGWADGVLERAARCETTAAVLGDATLVTDLALLAMQDARRYGLALARFADRRFRMRNIQAAVKQIRDRCVRAAPADAAGPYRIAGRRTVWRKETAAGAVDVVLADFNATIVEAAVHDDGAESQTRLALEGELADGRTLPRIEIPAEKFGWMHWPLEQWGPHALVHAGASVADHLRAAIQLLSGDVPTRTVYAHLGWCEAGSGWVYLHAGGGLGAEGLVDDIEVSPPPALQEYVLPDPPTGRALAAAVKASLGLLDLAPDRMTASLLGAVYRAVPGPADYTLHLAGPTGVGKTELAAVVCQSHWGAGLDARHLPGSWSSTGNSLETLANLAAHAVLVADDFSPGGSQSDVSRAHREADRLIRAAGNHSARSRCRIDGTVRPPRPPQRTIVSTGEDVPRGMSLRARLLVLELSPGDLDWDRLTTCQRQAGDGLLASALSAYLVWLAPQYPAARAGLRAEVAALRAKIQNEPAHRRTPDIVANLVTGWKWFLDFALDMGVIGQDERERMAKRVWTALLEAAGCQAESLLAAEPADRFVRLVVAVLASGRGHLLPGADWAGWAAPVHRGACGWKENTSTVGDKEQTGWVPQGHLIGWIDKDGVYLQPNAAYAETQGLAREQGEAIPLSDRSLWRRLQEKGHLATWDERRGRHLVRRRVGGNGGTFYICGRTSSIPPKHRPHRPRQTQTIDRKGLGVGPIPKIIGPGPAPTAPDRPRLVPMGPMWGRCPKSSTPT
jgi:hypothetical protein